MDTTAAVHGSTESVTHLRVHLRAGRDMCRHRGPCVATAIRPNVPSLCVSPMRAEKPPAWVTSVPVVRRGARQGGMVCSSATGNVAWEEVL